MNPLIELLADGPLAALYFRTGGSSSRNVRAFIAELATVLNGTPKKPLVISNDHKLVAVFRFFQYAELQDARGLDATVDGGTRFADIDEGYKGRVYIGTCGAGAKDATGVELPEDGSWASGRTPDNTVRSALPVFDGEMIYKGIESLLQKWTQAGKLVAVALSPTRYAGYKPDFTVELDYHTDPGDWDLTDPRRRDPELTLIFARAHSDNN